MIAGLLACFDPWPDGASLWFVRENAQFWRMTEMLMSDLEAATKEQQSLSKAYETTPYFKWMRGEGIPVIQGIGVEDIRAVQLEPWARMGGKGAFIALYGMEGTTGMYVCEIPPGGSLEPEKHMYEEVICILAGNGSTEIWQEGGSKHSFEWGKGSLFAPPLNTWHRLYNGSNKPVRFYAMTLAPTVIDLYRDMNFIFNCPFKFE